MLPNIDLGWCAVLGLESHFQDRLSQAFHTDEQLLLSFRSSPPSSCSILVVHKGRHPLFEVSDTEEGKTRQSKIEEILTSSARPALLRH